jgi:hypothetical protein
VGVAKGSLVAVAPLHSALAPWRGLAGHDRGVSTVVMHAVVSVDGFIADAGDDVGPLFEWYFNGEAEIVDGGPFKVSEASIGSVPLSRTQRGLPRRVSSMPSTRVGSGAVSSASACSTNAACAVGHATENAPATSATLRAASPTATPIARRSRPVVR